MKMTLDQREFIEFVRQRGQMIPAVSGAYLIAWILIGQEAPHAGPRRLGNVHEKQGLARTDKKLLH